MKRVKKGNPGYIRYEKIKRGLIMILMFAIPLIIFASGVYYTGTRKNLLTIVAIVGILPAAKCAVSWIMIMLQKDAPAHIVEQTEQICPGLVRSYELTVTAYEGRMPLDAVVIRNGSIACYSSYGKAGQFSFMEKHIEDILKKNGHAHVKVKIFSDEKAFTGRISSLAKIESQEQEKENRDKEILNVIKAISV